MSGKLVGITPHVLLKHRKVASFTPCFALNIPYVPRLRAHQYLNRYCMLFFEIHANQKWKIGIALLFLFLDVKASLAPVHVCLFVCWSVRGWITLSQFSQFFLSFLIFSSAFSVFPRLSHFFLGFLTFSSTFSLRPQTSQFFLDFLTSSLNLSVFPQFSQFSLNFINILTLLLIQESCIIYTMFCFKYTIRAQTPRTPVLK